MGSVQAARKNWNNTSGLQERVSHHDNYGTAFVAANTDCVNT